MNHITGYTILDNSFIVATHNLSDARDLLKFIKCLVAANTERVEQIIDKVDKLTVVIFCPRENGIWKPPYIVSKV